MRDIYGKLLETKKVSRVESHFAIGAALSAIVGGSDASCVRSPFAPTPLEMSAATLDDNLARDSDALSDDEMTGGSFGGEFHFVERDESGIAVPDAPRGSPLRRADDELVSQYVRELMSKIVVPTAAAVARSAGSLWLLTLLKFLSKHAAVRARMRDAHILFSWLLSDSNELAQEVAARGLSLIYELASADGDEAVQKELVQTLLRTLSGGKAASSGTAFKVSDESEILPEAVRAPKSAGGGKLSTYKELCSMASDIGQVSFDSFLRYNFLLIVSRVYVLK